MNELKLSENVVDTLTGFTGVVTAICYYSHSTTRVQVTSPNLNDGKIIEEWFDLPRLVKA